MLQKSVLIPLVAVYSIPITAAPSPAPKRTNSGTITPVRPVSAAPATPPKPQAPAPVQPPVVKAPVVQPPVVKAPVTPNPPQPLTPAIPQSPAENNQPPRRYSALTSLVNTMLNINLLKTPGA